MRLCIPTINERGLTARLSPHFGSAPYHTVIESDTGEASVIVNEHARHEHGRCEPAKGLEGRGVGAVVCRGLGRRALAALNGAGIEVLVTEGWTVAEALDDFREGRLASMSWEAACEGVGHGHVDGHGHGHHHGYGRG
ncbi:MAG: NifB/NifX family molybdenum-iron cluster-binding protein [Gemmatimonadetes bacterium]|nr:NifB/NifX family molybdenum-iron cluster-binding protein [Gemmatimonadota bacterium]